VVRNKINSKINITAQKKVTLSPGRHKVVILDEVDRCALVAGLRKAGWEVITGEARRGKVGRGKSGRQKRCGGREGWREWGTGDDPDPSTFRKDH
jgi:hypothetical protein